MTTERVKWLTITTLQLHSWVSLIYFDSILLSSHLVIIPDTMVASDNPETSFNGITNDQPPSRNQSFSSQRSYTSHTAAEYVAHSFYDFEMLQGAYAIVTDASTDS